MGAARAPEAQLVHEWFVLAASQSGGSGQPGGSKFVGEQLVLPAPRDRPPEKAAGAVRLLQLPEQSPRGAGLLHPPGGPESGQQPDLGAPQQPGVNAQPYQTQPEPQSHRSHPDLRLQHEGPGVPPPSLQPPGDHRGPDPGPGEPEDPDRGRKQYTQPAQDSVFLGVFGAPERGL